MMDLYGDWAAPVADHKCKDVQNSRAVSSGTRPSRAGDRFSFLFDQWRSIGQREEKRRKLVLPFGGELAERVERLAQ